MADLTDQVVALAHEVTQLRAELARSRRLPLRTMKQTFRCPACGHGRVLHVRRVQEYAHPSRMADLSLTSKPGMWGTHEGDPLEAFVCAACRLVEWHVIELVKTVVDGDEVIERVAPDAEAPPGEPYR